MNFVKNNMLLASFLIVACGQIQAMSIDSDTIKTLYKNGLSFAAGKSLDYIAKSDTIQSDKGFTKLAVGLAIVAGENCIREKNSATCIAQGVGLDLILRGIAESFFPAQTPSFRESVAYFLVDDLATPIVIDIAAKRYDCSKEKSLTMVSVAKIATVSLLHHSCNLTPVESKFYTHVAVKGGVDIISCFTNPSFSDNR